MGRSCVWKCKASAEGWSQKHRLGVKLLLWAEGLSSGLRLPCVRCVILVAGPETEPWRICSRGACGEDVTRRMNWAQDGQEQGRQLGSIR